MNFRTLRRGAVLAILAFACLVFGLRVPQAYMNLRAKREHVRELQKQNEALRKENEQRKRWIEDVSKNPSQQENLLRERYHKQRQGDTTFIIQPEKK